MKVASSTTAGLVLGMANTIVIPPARAAAVPVLKSSLCTAPGSLDKRADITRQLISLQSIRRIMIFSWRYVEEPELKPAPLFRAPSRFFGRELHC